MREFYRSPVESDYASQANYCVGETLSAAGRRHRLAIIGMVASAWIVVLVGRLYILQLTEWTHWKETASKQHVAEMTLASERGPVFDRNGKLMAVSVPTGSIYVRPKQIKEPDLVVSELARILELTPHEIRGKLSSPQPFVWIKRQVPRVYAQQIEELGMAGVGNVIEARRFYPYNEAASTLIGKVGIDGNGLSGIEALYEKRLAGTSVKSVISRDALGNRIELAVGGGEHFQLPKGSGLSLTLDAALQTIADEELANGREVANAKAAMAVMIDADTGEVLALSQAPGVNFNHDTLSSRELLKNRIVETVFEPGSVMKPLVVAAALDTGVIGSSEVIDCENGNFAIGRHMINDVHPNDELSVHDVVVRSSNIGMTKIGRRLGRQRLYDYLSLFGFGKSSGLDLPGETNGILRHPKRWAEVDIATHSFGQGVAVNPLQVVRAVSVIANGGTLPTLSLIRGMEAGEKKRIISERAAAHVRDMMYDVVESEHGTGKRAALEGVRVGGKTGTAQRPRENGRGYEPDAYISSFVGFADATPLGLDRRFALMVVIDRPNTDSIYGGTLAAPVFRRIMQKSLHLLTTRTPVLDPKQEAPLRVPPESQSFELKNVGFRVS